MSGDGRKPSDKPPWLKGVVGVTGVVPPGRRLSDASEHRPNAWSASGVSGVTPPGHAQPGGHTPTSGRAGPQASDRTAKANRQAWKRRRRSRTDTTQPEAVRPQAGFLPDVFADVWDPPDLQDFLKLLSEFLEKHPPHEDAIDDVDHLITQSQAPFDLIVGFTIMSALVRNDDGLRQDFAVPLERGANAFFNLARRLNPHVRIPRGVMPDVVDALFFDLPDLARHVPLAFATDAFARVMGLIRYEEDEPYDETLLTFALELRQRFIENRSFGDQPLADLFPWSLPDWTPASFDEP